MKKLLAFLLILACLLTFTACPQPEEPGEPPRTVTVTFDTNGSPLTNTFTRQVVAGVPFMGAPIPPHEGYELAGWYHGDERWNFNTDTTETDITLVARWAPLSYVVSFSVEGDVWADQEVRYGERVEYPEFQPEIEGYRFIAWTYNGEEWDFDTMTVTGKMTLSAYFEPVEAE